MIFKYDELREYVAEDFERFYKLGFSDEQIYPAILNEYEHGEGFYDVENICIHIFTALNYKEKGLNYNKIVGKIKQLLCEGLKNKIEADLRDEYSKFLVDLNKLNLIKMY